MVLFKLLNSTRENKAQRVLHLCHTKQEGFVSEAGLHPKVLLWFHQWSTRDFEGLQTGTPGVSEWQAGEIHNTLKVTFSHRVVGLSA